MNFSIKVGIRKRYACICTMFGLFGNLHIRNMDFDEESCRAPSSEFDGDHLKAISKADCLKISEDVAEELYVNHNLVTLYLLPILVLWWV